MSPVPSLRGRFVWHELMTSDTAAAIAFYTKVVGWKIEAWAEMPDYKMWVGARGPVGGLMTIPEEAKLMGAPPSWLAYIGTPSADATAEQAVRLGGKILKPADGHPHAWDASWSWPIRRVQYSPPSPPRRRCRRTLRPSWENSPGMS